MAVTSGFFNSLNGDRRYNAEQMSEIFNGIINDGVFSSVGTAFAVTASEGNTVTIGIGRGWFNSAWIYNDAILPLTLSNSETLLNRIDAVVIEINHSIGVRSGSIKVVNGTPATTPENPTLANIDDVHQYPLAYIYRAAGSTSIVQANITNKVGTSDCPYVTGILEVQNIDNIVAQWQSEFDIWFANLEDSLSGDVAVKLANDILALQSQFEDLALYKTVYVELEDSQDNTIQDSNGNPIYGATTFGDSNTEGGSSGQPVVVSESQYKPGDTLTTARNDLDESWLLCNGAEITRTDYPQLAAQFSPKPTDPYAHDIFWTPAPDESLFNCTSTAFNIIFENGYYVTAGQNIHYMSNERQLMYALNVDGPWTTVDLSSYMTMITRLTYVNGYYIVTGSGTVSNSNYNYVTGRILYATNPNGPWTAKDIWQSSSRNTYLGANGCTVFDIAYGNGYYVAVGVNGTKTNSSSDYYGDSLIGYCATLDGTWNTYTLDRDHELPYSRIINKDNVLIMIGTSPSQIYRCSTAPTGGSAWTWVGSYSNMTGSRTGRDISYVNGGYIVTGYTRYASVTTSEFEIYEYADEILYTSVDIANGEITDGMGWERIDLPFKCSKIIYNDSYDYYVAFGSMDVDGHGSIAVAYATDLKGPWTSVSPLPATTTMGSDYSTPQLNDGMIVNGIYIGVGGIANDSSNVGAVLVYSDTEVFTLPSISLSDKTYTYIKAKED